MALVGSGVLAGGGPLRQLGANTAGAAERGNWSQSGMLRSFGRGDGGMSAGASICDTAGLPNGHTHPSAWALPQKGGGMSAYKSINGAGDISAANLAMGRAISAALDGSGDITAATLALIVSLSAGLTGDGEVTAALKGAVQMAATLAASGDLTAALGALVSMSAALSGAGGVDVASTLRGVASMTAEILSYGELTPEGIRDSVWGALQAAINNPGTAGAALLAAGSAGDPWSTALPGSYTGLQAGALLDAMNTLLAELHRIHGLEVGTPLIVTDTSREAGAITQTLTEALGTVTVERT